MNQVDAETRGLLRPPSTAPTHSPCHGRSHLSYVFNRPPRELLASMSREISRSVFVGMKGVSQRDVCSLLSANNCRNVRLCALEIPIGPYTFTKGRLAQCSSISYHIEIIASPLFFLQKFFLILFSLFCSLALAEFPVLLKFLSDSPNKNCHHGL
jgi:hypothetical protein